MIRIIIFLFIVLFIYSCTQNNDNIITKHKSSVLIKNKTSIDYAKGFDIEYFNNYKLITVYNPWDSNAVYWQYYIYKDSTEINNVKAGKVFNIKSKLEKTIALSGAQIAFLDKLNLLNKISAVSDSKYIFNRNILNKVKNERVEEVGDVMNLNYEKIIFMSPDIVFATGWDKFNNSLDKISKLNIPIAYVIEWQENTPLARAEWIKFIAAFYDKEELADSVFNSIVDNYNDLKNKAKTIKDKPTILHGNMQGDSWYVPGGKSYVANIYKDAGLNYLWSNNTSKGSVPFSFEDVYLRGLNADFWFTNEAFTSNNNFIVTDERYRLFSAYKNNKIFANTVRITKFGGNDYWESGVINPDIILRDIISLVHPNLIDDGGFYYKQLMVEE